MKNHYVMFVLIFATILTSYGCNKLIHIDSNIKDDLSADSEYIEIDTVYESKEKGDKLVANSDGSFILYIDNEYPIQAVGGNWVKNDFVVEFEYVECTDHEYIYTRKVSETLQESFKFNNNEWIKDMNLSSNEIYDEKINIFKESSLPEEYMVIDNELSDEAILTNSVLQQGGTTIGSTYSNIIIFSEDNAFRYYCSGFGSDSEEIAEAYHKRVKYLRGSWRIENNQILLKIEESEIKSGGRVEYDVISMFHLVDYETTHELDGTTLKVDYNIHIDDINPRYGTYIEINEDKYYFISGYKLYHKKDNVDYFIENFAY